MNAASRSERETVHRVGLPPVVGEGPKVLILGTIPSVRSIEKMEYYGNPRNHFWNIIYALFQAEPEIDYGKKIRFITERRIALWDVLAECDIRGSRDQSIINPVVNDIEMFFRENKDLDHIFLNGKVAGTMYDLLIKDNWPEGRPRPVAYTLPSSSTANAIGMGQKVETWAIVRKAVEEYRPNDVR
ncbi:MAG: DNA-deoxyinosine glycosylase [Methanomassiliicoccales archaeon]|nr:DNA-deoxyinosine glycosylase [Methanomassiliicoccales archaeon]